MFWFVWVPFAAPLTACGEPLAANECEALLDHYVEKLVRKRRPEAVAGEIERLKAEARALARSNPTFEFESCPDEVSRSQFECAMQSPTVDDIERCLVF